MSRDPLGSDPLGIDPVVHIHQIKNLKLAEAIQAYRNNILLRGTTIARTIEPGQVVGEDGKVLTNERRQEIAAARVKFSKEAAEKGLLNYHQDAPPVDSEQLGASAQKAIDKQPEMTIVKPIEIALRPLTDQERLDLDLPSESSNADPSGPDGPVPGNPG